MEAYVKSFATYRTIKQATAISSPLVLDSMDGEGDVHRPGKYRGLADY